MRRGDTLYKTAIFMIRDFEDCPCVHASSWPYKKIQYSLLKIPSCAKSVTLADFLAVVYTF